MRQGGFYAWPSSIAKTCEHASNGKSGLCFHNPLLLPARDRWMRSRRGDRCALRACPYACFCSSPLMPTFLVGLAGLSSIYALRKFLSLALHGMRMACLCISFISLLISLSICSAVIRLGGCSQKRVILLSCYFKSPIMLQFTCSRDCHSKIQMLGFLFQCLYLSSLCSSLQSSVGFW